MEFEKLQQQTILANTLLDEKNIAAGIKSVLLSDDDDDLIHSIEAFHLQEKGFGGAQENESWEKKILWLRSQIIGADFEFNSPFGKRMLTYADHMASGRSLQFIENYIMRNVLPVYGNTHTSDSFVGCQTTKMVHEASNYIKKCLGGRNEDAIIFCGNGTTAAIKRLQEIMGVAIPSVIRDKALQFLKEEERWVVFVGPYEHHSNILSWRQSLAEVVEIPLDDINGLIDMEVLRAQLELYRSKNRQMLGSFSACSNVSGIISDTRAIASLLHQYGAFACFDFAASAPSIKIDMRSGDFDGYDAVFFSPHKFLGGPGSPGILLMNEALYQLRSSPPSTCGGGTVDFVNCYTEEDTLYMKNVEEREDAGTPAIIQKIRAALVFWVKEYIGHDVIERKEHFYIQQALNRLTQNPNLRVLVGNSTTDKDRKSVLSFLIHTTTNISSSSPQDDDAVVSSKNEADRIFLWRETGNNRDKYLHGPFVAKLLNDLFGIQARGGCACAGPYAHTLLKVDRDKSIKLRSAVKKGYSGLKLGWTRVSFSYYMCKAEFEFIIAALEFLAIYGQRFLPLYNFNWKTGAWNIKTSLFGTFSESMMMNNSSEDPISSSSLLLSDLVEELNAECRTSTSTITATGSSKDSGVIGKYAKYLEAAKRIAAVLPKFPPQRRIPEEIDPKLVYFRV